MISVRSKTSIQESLQATMIQPAKVAHSILGNFWQASSPAHCSLQAEVGSSVIGWTSTGTRLLLTNAFSMIITFFLTNFQQTDDQMITCT
jgi:hypothetical protein